MNERIKIKDLLAVGSYPEAGAKLYWLANPLLAQKQPIEIDMSDVASVPTLFMNISFGRLMSEYGKEPVMRSIRFFNISRSQLERFKSYFQSY